MKYNTKYQEKINNDIVNANIKLQNENKWLYERLNQYEKELGRLKIIEEKKIPEKLNITYEKNCKNNYKWKCEGYNISTPQKLIADKVNSIIDYLESKGE